MSVADLTFEFFPLVFIACCLRVGYIGELYFAACVLQKLMWFVSGFGSNDLSMFVQSLLFSENCASLILLAWSSPSLLID